MRLPQPTKFMEKKLLNAMIISHRLVFVWRNLNEGTRYILFDSDITLGARGFSCVVSGFGQSFKKVKCAKSEKFFLAASPLVSSAFGRTRVGLRPTKRSSPSHARKILWYPGYSGVLSLRNKTS